MRLNEILEENTVKGISQKTKISEDNLENLLASNFDSLKKIKVLGFISIIEREYNADLSALKEEALAFYSQKGEEKGFSVGVPFEEEKKGTSKLFLIVVLSLLAYASWYFFTQFDKKHLSGLIPFMDEQMVESMVIGDEDEKQEVPVEDLSIASAVANNTKVIKEETMVIKEEIIEETKTAVQETNLSSDAMTDEQNDSTLSVNNF